MNILLTGASGMLASDVVPQLLRQGHSVIQTDLRPRTAEISLLDITHRAEVVEIIERVRPDYIFHLAAETDVDLCEKDPDHAFATNTIGTENIALVCQAYDIPLLYISTAAVFSGYKPLPYTEFDSPQPANVYGDSKLQGEIIIQRLLSRYFIIRAGWMIGGWLIDKKFVYKIVQQLCDGKKELSVVNDKFGSPTFTTDFAANLMRVIQTKRYGLYHMANRGTCSRFDIATKIVEYCGLAGQITLLPINSAQFPLPAPRARSEMMTNYKLELLDLNTMPTWQESLGLYIQENYNNQKTGV